MYLSPWLNRFRTRKATRSSTRRSARRARTERLETRTLLTVVGIETNPPRTLTVFEDGGEDLVVQQNINTGDVEVLADGVPVSGIPVIPAMDLEALQIFGGENSTTIDVSALDSAIFTSLTSVMVEAGDGHDQLIGSDDFDETLIGGHGNDTIDGAGGADSLSGGDGNDMLTAGDGDDQVDGGDGNDTVTGDAGADNIDTGDGSDSILGGTEADTIDSGLGTDFVDGGTGDDSIVASQGADTVMGGDGADIVYGGSENDSIDGGIGNDTLLGQGGEDTILGNTGDDSIDGGGSGDSISAGAGNDFALGGLGNDTVTGDAGNDNVLGGGGHDDLDGGPGNDNVRGQGGHDTLSGGGDSDSVEGGNGNDLVQSVRASVSIGDAVLDPEGAPGATGSLTFDLTLFAALNESVTVSYATSDGSASAGSDYTAASGAVTFAPGQTSQTIDVTVLGDIALEGNETLVVNLTSIVGPASIADATATGTIVDDELGTPILSFPGQSFNFQRPDAVGDVGPNHFVQAVNSIDSNGIPRSEFAVYDRNGNLLQGPTVMSSLSSGGLGASGFGGDPIVAYDHLADRWLLVEATADGTATAVYVSQTPDPTGTYYEYIIPALNPGTQEHFQKFAVAPDVYYLSVEERDATNFNHLTGPAYALDRASMLQGLPASPPQRFTVPNLPGWPFLQALTPADLDGPAPPAGSPGYFMRHRDDELHTPGANNSTQDFLEVWALQADFATPGNSTLTQVADVPVSEFNSLFLNNGIVQPNTAVQLQILESVITNRLQYRNFGTYETLVGNFTVNVGPGAGTDQAGLRWFELRKVGAGPWTLFQEGTHAPDTTNRWLGAISMDGRGNITLAYNVSSSSVFPGLRYVGRSASDPPGTLPQGEFVINDGFGSQTNFPFFGDYSALTVDPVDDRTFWFTGEYLLSGGNWATQIATMRFGDSAPTVIQAPLSDTGDTLDGSDGNDTLIGSFGDDLIRGGNNNDSLLGGDGDDTLEGNNGADTINGEGGDDSISGNAANDLLSAGGGSDVFVWNGELDATDTIEETIGFQSVIVNGDAGNDTFAVDTDFKSLRITEGAGSITVSSLTSNVTVNLGDGDDTVTIADTTRSQPLLLEINGELGNDTVDASGSFLGPVLLRVNGGDGSDTVRGSESGETVNGGDGDDEIDGNRGNDVLNGDDGNDTIDGGLDNDTIDGGTGDDALAGGDGNDDLSGGIGNDVADGEAGDDTVRGNDGNDQVIGSFGNDLVEGNNGDDGVIGGSGNDSMSGGTGHDFMRGNSGDDQMKGGDGHDTIKGDAGADVIDAGDGDDRVEAGDGANIVDAGDGADSVVGGRQSDTILGGDGHDLLMAAAGKDSVFGGDGDDTIKGHGSFDRFNSGDGDNDAILDLAANETDDEDLVIPVSVLQALALLNGF